MPDEMTCGSGDNNAGSLDLGKNKKHIEGKQEKCSQRQERQRGKWRHSRWKKKKGMVERKVVKIAVRSKLPHGTRWAARPWEKGGGGNRSRGQTDSARSRTRELRVREVGEKQGADELLVGGQRCGTKKRQTGKKRKNAENRQGGSKKKKCWGVICYARIYCKVRRRDRGLKGPSSRVESR